MYNVLCLSLSEIKKMLNSLSELDEILILLSVAEFNLISEIEIDEKLEKNMTEKPITENKFYEDDADDDLLSAPSQMKNNTKSFKDQEHVKEEIKKKKTLLEEIRKIIKAVVERPMDFVGESAIHDINKKINRKLLPTDKSIRGALAKNALFKLIEQKENDERLDKKIRLPSEF